MSFKRMIVVFLLVFATFSIGAQEKELQVSEEQIKETVEKVIDEEYIRIPKKDFEAILETRFANLVNSKIKNFLGIAVAIIGLLSALSLFRANKSRSELKEYFQSRIDTEFSKGIKTIGDDLLITIDSKIESLKIEMKNADDKLTNEIDKINNDVDQKLISIEQQNQQTKRQLSRAENYLTNLEIANLHEKILHKNIAEDDINIGYQLLQDIKASNTGLSRIPRVIDLLSNILYSMNKSDYDSKLYDLISTYEKEYDLNHATYVNGGLIAFDKYHKYATALHQRENALSFIDKSLKIDEGYGTALALKLETFMMDYIRARVKKDRDKAFENAENTIMGIINSNSDRSAYETLIRLISDSADPNFNIKKEVNQMATLFKDEMTTLFSKANNYAVKNGYNALDSAILIANSPDNET